MAEYTEQLIEVLSEMNEYPVNIYNLNAIPILINNNMDKIFAHYPIWDERYRKVLNAKILSHYLYREIGQETPALFIFFLNRKMNEIMPYYNELYKTIIPDINQVYGIDYYEEYYGKEEKTTADKSDTETGRTQEDTRNTDTSKTYSSGQERSDETDTTSTRTPDLTETGTNNRNTTGTETGETGTDTNSEKNVNASERSNASDTGSKTITANEKGTGVENSQENSNETGTSTVSYGKTDTREDKLTQEDIYASGESKSGSDKTKVKDVWKEKFNDTPQGGLEDIESMDYLTTYTSRVDTTDSTVTYGSRTDKDGKDTRKNTGTQTNRSSGSDVTESNSEKNGTSEKSKTETKEGTNTETSENESNLQKTNESIETGSTVSSESKVTNKNEEETGQFTTKNTGTEKNVLNSTVSGSLNQEGSETLGTTDTYISQVTGTTGVVSSGIMEGNDSHTRHTWGRNQGSGWIDEIMKWRNSIINIDMMIIKELSILFFDLW